MNFAPAGPQVAGVRMACTVEGVNSTAARWLLVAGSQKQPSERKALRAVRPTSAARGRSVFMMALT